MHLLTPSEALDALRTISAARGPSLSYVVAGFPPREGGRPSVMRGKDGRVEVTLYAHGQEHYRKPQAVAYASVAEFAEHYGLSSDER